MLASSAPLVLACVFVAALAQLSTSAVARAAQPAAGSNGILAAADAGARVVVGRTGEPRKLDVHGSIVNVRVGQVLAGNVEAGESLSIVWEEPSSSRPSRFEKGGRIAAGAVILPGIEIGEGAMVGAGAVVTHNVKPWTVVAGNPARFLRKVTPEERGQVLESSPAV